MKFRRYSVGFSLVLALLLCLAASGTYAQGRGGGRGNGGGNGGGRPTTMGNPGVDRGIDMSSSRSNGRSDDGRSTASMRSNGRSDNGIDRARLARQNAARMSDTELNRYRGLSKKLGTTPEQMRAAYQAALLANPDLRYGQFVAANVVADNLHTRYPAVTSSAILAGLANGDSIGHTLRSLGVGGDEAKAAEKDANRKIKEAKNRD